MMVKQRYTYFLLLIMSGLLLGSLGSCSLYRKVVHPYRLPTPKPSPEFIAQQKAEKKAREARERAANENAPKKSGIFRKKDDSEEEAATDVSTPTGAPLASSTAATPEARTLPERSTVRYDKHQMMKKPKLNRRKIHKQRKGFHPIESIRNFFKFGLHAKPNYSPDHRPAPKQPAAAPDAAPADAEPTPGGPPAAPDAGPTGKP
jgi:hypothetical protein